MEKIRSIGTFIFISLLIGLTSCLNDDSFPEDDSVTGDEKASSLVILVETDSLVQEEIDGLYWMREEEKLARDVYDLLYETYAVRIFDNISNSEQSHTDAVLMLINFYGLQDPALITAGEFSNSNLQQLYDALLLQGTVSIVDALMTGALIEEVDIIDLENEMAATSNVNLLAVYENLLEGSKRHLVSFVKNLGNYGVTYSPQKLDSAVYEEILATTATGGNGRY